MEHRDEFRDEYERIPDPPGAFVGRGLVPLQQKFNPAAAQNAMTSATAQTKEQQGSAGLHQQDDDVDDADFSVFICATSNTAFALYWFVSSLYAFSQMKVVDLVKRQRRKNRKFLLLKAGGNKVDFVEERGRPLTRRSLKALSKWGFRLTK